jgi:hypothetical protein
LAYCPDSGEAGRVFALRSSGRFIAHQYANLFRLLPKSFQEQECADFEQTSGYVYSFLWRFGKSFRRACNTVLSLRLSIITGILSAILSFRDGQQGRSPAKYYQRKPESASEFQTSR